VVPDPQEGADPVPPEVTDPPAVEGTHNHPGFTDAHADPAVKHDTTTAAHTALAALARITRISSLPLP
jgi:hypothetical protein